MESAMRRIFVALVLFAAACSHGSTSQTTVTINRNQVPASVQGAFYSEHPYATMSGPIQEASADNQTVYIIGYTRTDGSKGTATYTSFGELQKDE
jgi:hypothetical protein